MRRNSREALVLATMILIVVVSLIPTAFAAESTSVWRSTHFPTLPVRINGGAIERPESLKRFNGQALHFVFDQQAQREGVLYVFTSEQGSRNYIATQRARRSDVSPLSFTGGCANFWEHDNRSGAQVWKCGNEQWATMGTWNDRISSIQTASDSTVCVWQHANFLGSSLWLDNNVTHDSLSGIGWNDRISSVKMNVLSC